MKIENPAFDYDQFGKDYSSHRKTEPHIQMYIDNALQEAQTVLNVGAGSGSYEPKNRYVISIEPSLSMRNQRLQLNKFPAINANATDLPFDDDSFDASLALVTIHHWPDIEKGLHELRRVTKNQVIIMTFDPEALKEFWNYHYFPELVAVEQARYPTIDRIKNALGGSCEIVKISIPLNCCDGFQEAFYGRPEAFLNKEVRLSQSAWGFLSDDLEKELVRRLQEDLETGEWDRKYGNHRTEPFFTGALRLIISTP